MKKFALAGFVIFYLSLMTINVQGSCHINSALGYWKQARGSSGAETWYHYIEIFRKNGKLFVANTDKRKKRKAWTEIDLECKGNQVCIVTITGGNVLSNSCLEINGNKAKFFINYGSGYKRSERGDLVRF